MKTGLARYRELVKEAERRHRNGTLDARVFDRMVTEAKRVLRDDMPHAIEALLVFAPMKWLQRERGLLDMARRAVGKAFAPLGKAGEFNEEDHPRHDAGSEKGGQFAPKGEGGSGGDAKSKDAAETKYVQEKPASKFDKAAWEKLDVGARKEAWEKLSATQRDEIADAANTVPTRMAELMEDLPERPADSGKPVEAALERLSHFKDRIHPQASETVKTLVTDYGALLDKAGASKEAQHELLQTAVESVATQEIEASTRQLGDHGAHHIASDARDALSILETVPGYDTPKERAAAVTAAVFHDAGYLTQPAQSFLDEGHDRWSAQHYSANLKDTVTAALGSQAAGEVEHMIRTHASTEIDWKRDPVASAMRTADNIALFHEEKLPPVFRYVEGNTEVLGQVGRKEISVEDAKARMRDNIAKTSLPDYQKEKLSRAVDELSGATPNFTLGMLGGKVQKFEWQDDHLKVTVRDNPQATAINKLGDFGQKQFGKFAKTFGVDPKGFQQDLNFKFKNQRTGATVLEGVWEKATAKSRIVAVFKRLRAFCAVGRSAPAGAAQQAVKKRLDGFLARVRRIGKDADFEEKHPRDEAGKFTEKGAGDLHLQTDVVSSGRKENQKMKTMTLTTAKGTVLTVEGNVIRAKLPNGTEKLSSEITTDQLDNIPRSFLPKGVSGEYVNLGGLPLERSLADQLASVASENHKLIVAERHAKAEREDAEARTKATATMPEGNELVTRNWASGDLGNAEYQAADGTKVLASDLLRPIAGTRYYSLPKTEVDAERSKIIRETNARQTRKADAEAKRTAAFDESKRTGKPVILRRWTENRRAKEGGEWGDYQFIVTEYAKPDGSTETKAVNTY